MTEVLPQVDLFAFSSYRSYLKAYADEWLRQGKTWRQLAAHCGFASPNFVQQLISGKRNLTQAAAAKMGRRLDLSVNGLAYLAELVRLASAKNAVEINSILAVMKRHVGRARSQSIKDTTIFDHWSYGLVFELFKTDRCATAEDLRVVETRVGLTSAQLEQAFDFLVQRGYLKPKGKRWVPADVEFLPQNDVRRINSQQNHLKFFVLAQHRINDDLADREFQGLTFAARSGRLPELKERVRAFIRSMNDEFAEDAGADQVVRLQLGLFKLLK